MNTANLLPVAQQQVQNFCANIQLWFTGNATNQQALYQAITDTFDPAFQLINGDGQTIDFTMLTQWLHQVYGQFPTRTVQLENLNGYATAHHVVVTYTEIQTTGDTQTTRDASAVFVIQDNQALWYHLVEVWK